MRVSVVGSSGRVGSSCARELVSRGHDVVGIDLRAPAVDVLGVQSLQGDVRDACFLATAVEGSDVVINVAGYNHPVENAPWDAYGTNVVGSFTVMRAAARTGVKRSIHASSVSAMGLAWAATPRQPHYLPIDRAHPAEPADHYGLSKLVTELNAESLCREFDHSAVAIRFPQVVDDVTMPQQAAAVAAEPTSGAPFRDLWSYIHLDDIARAFADAAEARTPGYELVTVVAPDTLSRHRTEDLLREHYPTVALRRSIPDRTPAWEMDDAARVLGRLPSISWTHRKHLEQRT